MSHAPTYRHESIERGTHCRSPSEVVMTDHDALRGPGGARGVDKGSTVARLLFLYPPLHLIVWYVLGNEITFHGDYIPYGHWRVGL